jgi:hypothetical protein
MNLVKTNVQKALALIADFIVKKRYSTSWQIVASIVGYDLDENPRLVRSQTFADDDYPACVLKFLTDVYEKSEDEAKFAISHIVRDGNIKDAMDPEYSSAFELIGIIPKAGVKTQIPISFVTTKYLDIEKSPDDFYKELIDQINACYQHALYPPAQILIRKLLENCLIDILRKRYGMTKVDMFYNVSKGHFHDFSTLLDNAAQEIKDFTHVKDSFNEELIKKINAFREQGNSSAHNINLDNQTIMSELDKCRNELNFVVKALFRTIGNL